MNDYKKYLKENILPHFADVGTFKRWVVSHEAMGPTYLEVFETGIGLYALFGADYIGGEAGRAIADEMAAAFGYRVEGVVIVKESGDEIYHVFSNKKKVVPYQYEQYVDDEFVLLKLETPKE